jgi:hypothetical protein
MLEVQEFMAQICFFVLAPLSLAMLAYDLIKKLDR